MYKSFALQSNYLADKLITCFYVNYCFLGESSYTGNYSTPIKKRAYSSLLDMPSSGEEEEQTKIVKKANDYLELCKIYVRLDAQVN